MCVEKIVKLESFHACLRDFSSAFRKDWIIATQFLDKTYGLKQS